MKITLIYLVSHYIRVKMKYITWTESWDQQYLRNTILVQRNFIIMRTLGPWTLPCYIWGLLHKTFTGEKLRLFKSEFSAYGKVNGKFMLTRVFRFYQSIFSGKSFMQWAPGVLLYQGKKLNNIESWDQQNQLDIGKFFSELLYHGSTVVERIISVQTAEYI